AGHCGVADAVRGKAEPQASGLVQGLSLPSGQLEEGATGGSEGGVPLWGAVPARRDRKSTRLNSSHGSISYAVFCLKKKKAVANVTASRGSRERTRKLRMFKPPGSFSLDLEPRRDAFDRPRARRQTMTAFALHLHLV